MTYFISYMYRTKDGFGFGNSTYKGAEKIKSHEDILRIRNEIAKDVKGIDSDTVVIMSYKKI